MEFKCFNIFYTVRKFKMTKLQMMLTKVKDAYYNL